MGCIIRYMIRWNEMIQDKMESIYTGGSQIYTPRHSVHLRYPCFLIHLPWLSVSQSSLYLCTLAVAQSSAKPSGGGGGDGEKQISLPYLACCPLHSWAPGLAIYDHWLSPINTIICTWSEWRLQDCMVGCMTLQKWKYGG